MKSIDGRRTVLKQGAALGAAVALGPVGLGSARAQTDELAPYKAAKVNWKQVEMLSASCLLCGLTSKQRRARNWKNCGTLSLSIG